MLYAKFIHLFGPQCMFHALMEKHPVINAKIDVIRCLPADRQQLWLTKQFST